MLRAPLPRGPRLPGLRVSGAPAAGPAPPSLRRSELPARPLRLPPISTLHCPPQELLFLAKPPRAATGSARSSQTRAAALPSSPPRAAAAAAAARPAHRAARTEPAPPRPPPSPPSPPQRLPRPARPCWRSSGGPRVNFQPPPPPLLLPRHPPLRERWLFGEGGEVRGSPARGEGGRDSLSRAGGGEWHHSLPRLGPGESHGNWGPSVLRMRRCSPLGLPSLTASPSGPRHSLPCISQSSGWWA